MHSKFQNEKYKQINDIIFSQWDPIGVYPGRLLSNEYCSYALELLVLSNREEAHEKTTEIIYKKLMAIEEDLEMYVAEDVSKNVAAALSNIIENEFGN